MRLLRKADPFGDTLGDFAMSGQNGHADLHGFRKPPLNRLRQLRGRRIREGARDGADDCFREFRFVADVDALKVAPECDLVAKCRRQQMTVCVAADIAKKRLMIDVTPNGIVKVQEIGKPHAQHTGAQRKVPRVPSGQVRRIGQRHQKVRTPRCRGHDILMSLRNNHWARATGSNSGAFAPRH